MLANAVEGAVFLLTTSHGVDDIWDTLPCELQEHLIGKKMKFYVIDAITLAEEIGLGSRINMIMQTAFFIISGILPKEEAVAAIKREIKKTYGSKGEKVVEMNYTAVDKALQNIIEVPVPEKATSCIIRKLPRPGERAGIRAARHGEDDRRDGRHPPRFGHARRRDLADGDDAVRAAQHRRPHPRLGARPLHPVRPVLLRLPPRHHPDEGLRS